MHITPDNTPDNENTGSALDLLSGGDASEASASGGPKDSNGDGRAEDSGDSQAEKDARAMGWRPEDEWDGPPGKWLDAKTFIERGEQIMPILRANNKKMREELLTQNKEISTLRESLATAQRSITALRKGYSEATKREVELAIADLKDKYKEARAEGDVDTELKIRENIDTLTAKAKKIEEEALSEDGDEDTKDSRKGKIEDQELSPEFKQWQSKNKWFGNTANKEDRERSDLLVSIGKQLRRDGETSVGIAFMDRCMEVLEERERGYFRTKSKIEPGGGSRGGGGGRAYDKLPKEAKQACHEDIETFVGPGKQFKTVKEWEDHYANLYGE